MKQAIWIVGLVVSILTALAGLQGVFPAEWTPYIVAAATIASVVFAYLKNPPDATK